VLANVPFCDIFVNARAAPAQITEFGQKACNFNVINLYGGKINPFVPIGRFSKSLDFSMPSINPVPWLLGAIGRLLGP
jgi:hypothetical protein